MQMKSNKNLPKSKVKVHHQMMKILFMNYKRCRFNQGCNANIWRWAWKYAKKSPVEPLLLPNLIKTKKNGIPLKTIHRPKVGKPLPKKKNEIKEIFELNKDSTWILMRELKK